MSDNLDIHLLDQSFQLHHPVFLNSCHHVTPSMELCMWCPTWSFSSRLLTTDRWLWPLPRSVLVWDSGASFSLLSRVLVVSQMKWKLCIREPWVKFFSSNYISRSRLNFHADLYQCVAIFMPLFHRLGTEWHISLTYPHNQISMPINEMY